MTRAGSRWCASGVGFVARRVDVDRLLAESATTDVAPEPPTVAPAEAVQELTQALERIRRVLGRLCAARRVGKLAEGLQDLTEAVAGALRVLSDDAELWTGRRPTASTRPVDQGRLNCPAQAEAAHMSAYLVVFERADDGGCGAYLPNAPGVVALGETREEVAARLQEAHGAYAAEMRSLGKCLRGPRQPPVRRDRVDLAAPSHADRAEVGEAALRWRGPCLEALAAA
jgi:predicted RNase H-like HicB family nuclease